MRVTADQVLQQMRQRVMHKFQYTVENFDRVFWKEDGYRSSTNLDERANAMAVCAGLADSSKYGVITGLIGGIEGNSGPYF